MGCRRSLRDWLDLLVEVPPGVPLGLTRREQVQLVRLVRATPRARDILDVGTFNGRRVFELLKCPIVLIPEDWYASS